MGEHGYYLLLRGKALDAQGKSIRLPMDWDEGGPAPDLWTTGPCHGLPLPAEVMLKLFG